MNTGSPMQRIIVSDIFGRTEALARLASELGDEVTIIDPYGGELMTFANEEQAYSYFIEHVGVKSYLQLLITHLDGLATPTSIIGFSAGAAALWQLAAQKNLKNITGMLLFYGGQIRHHQELTPTIPVTLVFPKDEPHFSIENLALALSCKDNVRLISTGYDHGFMNTSSRNYHHGAYSAYVGALRVLGTERCCSQLLPEALA